MRGKTAPHLRGPVPHAPSRREGHGEALVPVPLPGLRARTGPHACAPVDILDGMKILARWLLLAAALLLVAHLYSGVEVRSFGAALVAALVLGLLNAVLRPVLVMLTLPVTIVTLGLFLFVINAAMFYAAAHLLSGFGVTDFTAALIGSLLYSACGLVIDAALERLFA